MKGGRVSTLYSTVASRGGFLFAVLVYTTSVAFPVAQAKHFPNFRKNRIYRQTTLHNDKNFAGFGAVIKKTFAITRIIRYNRARGLLDVGVQAVCAGAPPQQSIRNHSNFV